MDCGEMEVAEVAADIESVAAHVFEVTAHEEAHAAAGAGQCCAVVATDGTGTDDGESP
jgi:hypothetical protein